ncbi:MAG: OB-fold nucleic acid binding domain-containing protein [Patescibacteria group bacterium]|nr:OB-fold nucleic acid binding domain-containing protein [Patescibacteria group bacterium]
MTNRVYIKNLSDHQGEEVTLSGWVDSVRNQGKMVFFDFRDSSGLVQCIVLSKSEALEDARRLNNEFVINIHGRVNPRPDKDKKPDILNGEIELEVLNIVILNECDVLPFHLLETINVDENLRLKYRYLDFRSQRMKKNLINRYKTQKFIRDYLDKEGFLEIETPLISAPTPEGSRSFVVPSRAFKGNFYSLPQSPQQYKQLLMVGGIDKYFQFARCMRDEDARGDRQPEFTQLDMEMAFVSEEDVISFNESLLIDLIKKNYPEKRIQQIPFPRMSYKEVMEKYGSDKPDIRDNKNDLNLLAFLWVVDFPMFEKTDDENLDNTGKWTYTHNPFSMPKEEFFDDFMSGKEIEKILTTQYDITLNGFEIGGGSLRNYEAKALKKTFSIMSYEDKRIEDNFGHIIKAFNFGAPPHGGIAWGFDRLLMILENEPNIREVIPFAKTGDGKDLLMNAPTDISEKQKKELGLK